MAIDPTSLDLPEQIESTRLVLKKPEISNSADYHQAIVESFDALQAWYCDTWTQASPTEAELSEWIEVVLSSWKKLSSIEYAVFEKPINFLSSFVVHN